VRVLGIDPGSRITGYGIIEVSGSNSRYIDCGCIRTGEATLPQRLKIIFASLSEIIADMQPDTVAIESVFMNRNADSALKLGRAQGAAMCAAVSQDLDVTEYTPAQVKQAVVGKGNAAKEQIQHMVKILLGLSKSPQADASDALAVALTHIHTSQTLNKIKQVSAARQGRMR